MVDVTPSDGRYLALTACRRDGRPAQRLCGQPPLDDKFHLGTAKRTGKADASEPRATGQDWLTCVSRTLLTTSGITRSRCSSRPPRLVPGGCNVDEANPHKAPRPASPGGSYYRDRLSIVDGEEDLP